MKWKGNLSVSSTKDPLIIITGPTAVGKTDLSIQLAKRIHGEIISADSIQVYKDLNIGSAKITKEEMQGIPHFLIDEFELEDEFNVTIFQRKAKQYIAEIRKRGHIPIIVGGTGFYIQALLRDIDFSEDENDYQYRKELEQLAAEYGKSYLHQMLQKVDKESSEKIPEGNLKRVIRALEYYKLTGKKISEHNMEEEQKTSVFNDCYFVLTDERSHLYERINQRVDLMMEQGLFQEVKALYERGIDPNLVSMQGIGYKQMMRVFTDGTDIKTELENIKQETRHFAKRQLTWFRRETGCIWLDKKEYLYNEDQILERMLEIIKEKGII